jgi:hypothetical protein
LKDYSESGKSAAQIIYDVSQEFIINPQVLIVLLQKEQGLITDTWPLSTQYKTATGYGCPDTAPCDSQYFGLTNQLRWSGRMFRAIMNNSSSWYTPYILGNNYIQYSPDSSCGGSTVNIQNRSTQALYNYTPYQPNQGALNAGWGTAPCGAYGNRNFYLYFTSWFGNTQGGPSYQWSLESFSIYKDSSRSVKINDGAQVTLQPGETAYGTVSARNTGAAAWTNETIFATTNTPVLGNASWPAFNKVSLLQDYPIAYNQLATYKFSITAPATAGSYYQSFNLHHANSIWLNDPGVGLTVHSVKPYELPASSDNILSTGSSLQNGQSIFSPERHSVLRFENNQLTLYTNFKRVWSTNIQNAKAEKLVNQTDGNLVIYSDTGKALWASGTDTSGPSNLKLQTDGNLALYSSSQSPTWSTNTATSDQVYSFNSVMRGDSVLFPTQSLTTADRSYRLILQTDGNLVLYSASNRAIWASNTDGRGVNRLVLQTDGNLVLYTNTGKAVWASNTDGSGITSLLSLQSDHNLVLYSAASRPVWASQTSGR